MGTPRPRRIALVAHDNRKKDMLEWASFNVDTLMRHRLVATGTTGSLLHDRLELAVERLASGPLGGDLQIGAQIVEARSTCWCSSGTRSSRSPTTPT